jgi:GNAT superfamily N-acetyltransferase
VSADLGNELRIRSYEEADREFLTAVVHRLHPGTTESPRDPAAMERFFAGLAQGELFSEPGDEAFVATIGKRPAGIIVVHPDKDYFTGHPRAYVDILVVAPEAEGQGVGRALLRHVEEWARERGFREVVLDVFAGNSSAIAFYDRVGYRPDHIRLTKCLDHESDGSPG